MLSAIHAALRFVHRPTSLRVGVLSLVCALTVLARLDTLIFTLILLFASARALGVRQLIDVARRPSFVVAALLGSMPLIVYVVTNLAVFGMVMPQSAAAKQIRAYNWFFNWRVLDFLLRPRFENSRDAIYFFLVGTLPCVLSVVALFGLRGPRLTPPAAIAVISSSGFALAYYALLSIISDWSVWIWYLYPVVVAEGLGR